MAGTARLAFLFLLALISSAAGPARLTKALSGPTGKVVENRFIFDTVRNRFSYPQDSFLVVYFEWEAEPGSHVLSAFWKDPEGKVATISPDVRIDTATSQLHAYWMFEPAPTMMSGVWTVEIRIDGEPAGSHSFELILPQAVSSPAQNAPKALSLDEIYRATERSMVWVYKVDAAGRRADTSLGFVTGNDQVTTAFQSIDGVLNLQIEFSDGRRVNCDQVWAASRLQDWAVLKVPTNGLPALRRAVNSAVPVGERMLAVNTENGTSRVIGALDIAGRRIVAGGYGERIQISVEPAMEAVGGPLLTLGGEYVGILGGSTAPGARYSKLIMSLAPSLWPRVKSPIAVTPIESVQVNTNAAPKTLAELLDNGTLTPPLSPAPSLVFGATARSVAKRPGEALTTDCTEFSRKDAAIWVYTIWQKRSKESKAVISARIYDPANHSVVTVPPRKLSLSEKDTSRLAFDFSPANLLPGTYRVDMLWDQKIVWRTNFAVTD